MSCFSETLRLNCVILINCCHNVAAVKSFEIVTVIHVKNK